ncbi:preprotein translocase subunit YajC [Poriferisphaera sp. WC338]|uniref:preprotein translocase subunit YajC n=1 Tax=Poriferisphaera sp. WC338 TaxID=3425129 RepID=UPI003D816348
MFEQNVLILAQTEAPAGETATGHNPPDAGVTAAPGQTSTTGAPGAPAGGTQNPPPSSPFGGAFIWILIGFVLLMFIFSGSSQRKEKKRKAALLAQMKKGSKVQSIGGIIGTVMDIREDNVIVKIDENTNTKMTFNRSAIQSVIEE